MTNYIVPNMAALEGTPVTQRHANYCAEHGHATHMADGTTFPRCPRCGEITESAPAPHRPTTVRDVFDALTARQVDAEMRTSPAGVEWCVVDTDDNGNGGWVDAGHDPGVVVVRGLGVLTDKPFTDAEAAAEYIAGRVTEIVANDAEFPRCERCGDPIDYCQGHGSY